MGELDLLSNGHMEFHISLGWEGSVNTVKAGRRWRGLADRRVMIHPASLLLLLPRHFLKHRYLFDFGILFRRRGDYSNYLNLVVMQICC